MHGCSWAHALVLLAALPLAAAQPVGVFCDSSSGNYAAGSDYETNLQRLLGFPSMEATDRSSSTPLFAITFFDTVYGLILCRGDITLSDCQSCVTFARSMDVALCYDNCYVRMSDKDFLASTDNSGLIGVVSGNIISSSDITGYDQAVIGLLNATVQYAVNSTELFATGLWVGPDPGFRTIYSAAQCAGDLSRAHCQSCLQDLLGKWTRLLSMPANRDGIRVAGSRCTLRSQVSPFYYGDAMVQLLPTNAAPPPTKAAPPTPEQAPGTTEDKKRNSTPIILIAMIVLERAVRRQSGLCNV